MANESEKVHDAAVKAAVAVEIIPDSGGVLVSPSAIAEGGKRVNAVVKRAASPEALHQGLPGSPKVDCKALAQTLSLQPVPKSKQDQWGLLTAVSEKARKRPQGSHIMLYNTEHVLGRTVAEVSCQFESPAVSGRHCTLSRKLSSLDGSIKPPGSDPDPGDQYVLYVKDSSSNGTYVNTTRLRKNGPELRVLHGDIISLVALSDQDNALAFVYREVVDDSVRQAPKRKTSPSADNDPNGEVGDGKRIRGISNGSSQGPVSLDDVRRLQRSNEDLRQELEAHLFNTEKMRNELRAAEARHHLEMKELQTCTANMYAQQIEDIRLELALKVTELEDSITIRAEQQRTLEDLNQRLVAAAQSRVDAENAIQSHKCSIAELEKRLEDERCQHEKERAESETMLRAAVERTRMEAMEDQKRQYEVSSRLQKQQQETILDLQEADKENRRLSESLRTKLEAQRQLVVNAEDKSRRLEVLLQDEQFSRDSARKKEAALQEELRQVYKQLESEKAARDSAWAKVESLELEMETAIRDLALEKQRLQGARERIVLRETQLRAFHSTAAEIEALQQKQQEQLKSMLRTLEDREEEDHKIKIAKSNVQGNHCGVVVTTHSTHAVSSIQKHLSPDHVNLHTSIIPKLKDGSVHDVSAVGKDLVDKGEGMCEKVDVDEQDWIGGDTQEDCDAVLDDPFMSKVAFTGTQMLVRNGKEPAEEYNAIQEVNSLKDNTQVLEHGQLDPTQLLQVTSSMVIEEAASVRESTMEGAGCCANIIQGRQISDGMDVDGISVLRDGAVGEQQLIRDCTSSRGRSDKAENDLFQGFGGETMQIEEEIGAAGTNTQGPIVLEDILKTHSNTYHMPLLCQTSNDRENLPKQLLGDLCSPAVPRHEGSSTNFEGEHRQFETSLHVGIRVHNELEETHMDRRDNDTICTDDLLTSEVAGSWALSTPASVGADNESAGSDEGNHCGDEVLQHGTEEGASQVIAKKRSQPDPQHSQLKEVLHLADPINSQSSLYPATTNLQRDERAALNQMLDIVDPGFGNLHGISKVIEHTLDTEDSTTDDEGENKDVDISSDGRSEL